MFPLRRDAAFSLSFKPENRVELVAVQRANGSREFRFKVLALFEFSALPVPVWLGDAKQQRFQFLNVLSRDGEVNAEPVPRFAVPVAQVTPLDQLCEKLGRRWHGIDTARQSADAEREKIAGILSRHALVPSDTSFVVFGSLARREWTIGSDVDWTLMVDGQVDPNHLKVAQDMRSRFEEAKLQQPGPTNTFGSLAFSHDIVHQIGGESDTNRNTTQRILLLLESATIDNPDAYERVISAVLNRYLDDDLSFLSGSGLRYKVPRFLLNDIVRYWRTMAVDYATKHRERRGDKWALRNTKLRMSRKLIFASGLLTCFNCYLTPPLELKNLFEIPEHMEPLLVHLRTHVRMTPLDILASASISFAKDETAIRIFDAYDEFLTMMNDGQKRQHLGKLKAKEAQADNLFADVRRISANFQEGLTRLFFDENEKLSELTRKYGLF